MAWYLEYERPVGQTDNAIKDIIDLDCSAIMQYQTAKRMAENIAQKRKLKNPKLIWVEAIRIKK